MPSEKATPPRGNAAYEPSREYSMVDVGDMAKEARDDARLAKGYAWEAMTVARRIEEKNDILLRPVARSPMEQRTSIAANFAIMLIAICTVAGALVGCAYVMR